MKRDHWSLDSFNDGYGEKRFMVFFPDHHRANKQGYIRRSIVAYESYHHCRVKRGQIIHHKNGNTLDDSRKNLELISSQSDHARLHESKPKIVKICPVCDKIFEVNKSKKSQTYCSKKCYSKHSRIKQKCPTCRKIFFPYKRAINRDRDKYCSRKCCNSSLEWNKNRISSMRKNKLRMTIK